MFANQYAVMKDQTNPNHSAIGRFDGKLNRVVPLISPSESIWGIHPRNMEQSLLSMLCSMTKSCLCRSSEKRELVKP